MPIRTIPLVNNHYYHVFNRTINNELAFKNKRGYLRAIKTIEYYRYSNPPLKLSYFLNYGHDKRKSLFTKLNKKELAVKVVCYCLMPDHYHVLVQQQVDNGVSKFMANLQNSFTKYINTKHDRYGHLFAGQYKAVRIPTDELLLHISRYIHLNPYASYVVKNETDLVTYPYSSLSEFLGYKNGFCEKSIIMNNFPNKSKYKEFVLNQKDYQRKLKSIGRFVLEQE